MKPVYAKRLLKLADFLEALPRKRFNFASYVGDDWAGKQDLSCGTTACALGWAASMPEFRRLGLRFKGTPAYDDDGHAITADGGVGLVDDEYADEEEASAIVFGLTDDQHAELFIPENEFGPSSNLPKEATPKQVAKNIRAKVKEWTSS